jgi:hypothetical protein
MNLPSLVNFWIVYLYKSATYTLLKESMARTVRDRVSFILSLGNSPQTVESVIPIVSLGLVVFLFAVISSYLGWPPAGDAIYHGFSTTLLVHNGVRYHQQRMIACK